MKKVIFGICAAVIVSVAAINVNLAVKDAVMSNVTLESIISLANGESDNCSVCGNPVDFCTCGPATTCDQSSCHGKQCHYDTGNYVCPCEANGDQYSFCLL